VLFALSAAPRPALDAAVAQVLVAVFAEWLAHDLAVVRATEIERGT
jgi:hypothetical protein